MTVTDEQVAVLQTQLAGRMDEHRTLLAKLDSAKDNLGYSALVAAGFFEAVDQRFAPSGRIAKDAEVVAFVASLRSVSDEVANNLDPNVAERLIRHSLGKGFIADIEDDAVASTQVIVLAGLIRDWQPSERELHDFMVQARTTADEWLADE